MKSLPKTDIEYLTHHWPVVTGCSYGCLWCWARRNAEMRPLCHGKTGEDAFPFNHPLLHQYRLDLPFRRKNPARIGVCFTGDLFGPEIDDYFIQRVFTEIQRSKHHKFLVLTKRAKDMHDRITDLIQTHESGTIPNVWLGVSATNQADADERIPLLLQTPAAHRWVSIEPMLRPVDLQYPSFNGCDPIESLEGISWVVVGSIDRPSEKYPAPKREWIDSIVEQCRSAGVPVWVKNNARKLYQAASWPQELPT